MFYSNSNFAFTRMLEQQWHTVRDECLALPSAEFVAWPETQIYNRGWDVYGLMVLRKPMLENCIFCLRTYALLQQIPQLVNAGFSRLAPGSQIAPHIGYTDQVLRLHLTLQSNPACGLRVAGETRTWIEGECLIFDDTKLHEAWNHGQHERLVLLLDFAKPQGM